MTVAERFEKYVVRSEGGCWDWRACKNEHGYGILGVAGKNERAHRVSWTLTNGPIPKGLRVLHRCDNPVCSNPQHLFLGTAGDNTQDMVRKGRARGSPPGEQSTAGHLREEDVYLVRELCAAGFKRREVGRLLGVSNVTVSAIARRVIWKHLPERSV